MKIELPLLNAKNIVIISGEYEYEPDEVKENSVVFDDSHIDTGDTATLCYCYDTYFEKQDFMIIGNELIQIGKKRRIEAAELNWAIDEVCKDIEKSINDCKERIVSDNFEGLFAAYAIKAINFWRDDHSKYDSVQAMIFKLYYERLKGHE
jgi:hypothetical protein